MSLSVFDRLSVFARSGANLTVTLVVVLAIVAVGTARHKHQGTGHPVGPARALMLVSGLLAVVVIVVNATVCLEIARNATGVYGVVGGNRAATFLQFLATVVLSIGVVWCANSRSRSPIPTGKLADRSSQ